MSLTSWQIPVAQYRQSQRDSPRYGVFRVRWVRQRSRIGNKPSPALQSLHPQCGKPGYEVFRLGKRPSPDQQYGRGPSYEAHGYNLVQQRRTCKDIWRNRGWTARWTERTGRTGPVAEQRNIHILWWSFLCLVPGWLGSQYLLGINSVATMPLKMSISFESASSHFADRLIRTMSRCWLNI
jgi:hypothetical protein